MAVGFVRGKSTGTGPEATLALTTEPAAGNWLCVFISKSANETQPKVSDNLGEAGWEVNATKVAGAFNGWFAKKKAVGGEKEIKAVEGTIQSITYAEVSGTSGVIDKITALGTSAKSKEATTAAFTSTDAGALFLCGVMNAGNTSLGTPEAWTGTGPLTNNQSSASRSYAGYWVPGALIEAKTFTCHHATEKEVNLLGVTLKPSAEAPPPTVSTEAATVTTTAATLKGKANPNSSEVTDCKYEWGTTEGLGSTIAVEQTVGSGSADVAVTANLTGLTPNTTYYYRLSATNANGTSKSTPIASLKTEAQPPEIELDPQVTEEAAGGTSPAPAMIL